MWTTHCFRQLGEVGDQLLQLPVALFPHPALNGDHVHHLTKEANKTVTRTPLPTGLRGGRNTERYLHDKGMCAERCPE